MDAGLMEWRFARVRIASAHLLCLPSLLVVLLLFRIFSKIRAKQEEGGEHIHRRPRLGIHARYTKILKDPPVQKLHHVKRRADNGVVLAQAIRLRHGNPHARGPPGVGLADGAHDAVLALDLVRRLGEELARGLLAEDIADAGGGGELVGGIGLTEAELRRFGGVSMVSDLRWDGGLIIWRREVGKASG